MLRTLTKKQTLIKFSRSQFKSKKSFGHQIRDVLSELTNYMSPILKIFFPSFIAVHYFYIIMMTFLQSLLMFPVRGQRYIDVLLISASTTSQGGLNTININSMTLYQQIIIYIICFLTTPIFIHSTLAFVRLYWFERYFDGIRDWSKRNFKMRRTRTLLQRELTAEQHPHAKLKHANTGLTFSLTKPNESNRVTQHKSKNHKSKRTRTGGSRETQGKKTRTSGYTSSMHSQHTNNDFQSRLFRGEMVRRDEEEDDDDDDALRVRTRNTETTGNSTQDNDNSEEDPKTGGLQLHFDIPDKPKHTVNTTTSNPVADTSTLPAIVSTKKPSSRRRPSFLTKFSFLNGNSKDNEKPDFASKNSARFKHVPEERNGKGEFHSESVTNLDNAEDRGDYFTRRTPSNSEKLTSPHKRYPHDNIKDDASPSKAYQAAENIELDEFKEKEDKTDKLDTESTSNDSVQSDPLEFNASQRVINNDEMPMNHSTEDLANLKIVSKHGAQNHHEHHNEHLKKHGDMENLVNDPDFQKQLYKKWKKEQKNAGFLPAYNKHHLNPLKHHTLHNTHADQPSLPSAGAIKYKDMVDSQYADMYRHIPGTNDSSPSDATKESDDAGQGAYDDDDYDYGIADEDTDSDYDYDDDYDDDDDDEEDDDSENDLYDGNDGDAENANVVLGRNSTFVGLTYEQKEELGGVEYRALKLLCKILICYYIGFHVLGFVLFVPWINVKRTGEPYQQVLKADALSYSWWGFFTSMSAFNDLGLTLTPDSMASFSSASYILIFTMFFIIIGNTGFPVFLRFIVWVFHKVSPDLSQRQESLKFLLEHPRRCFTLLFPKAPTWWLLLILVVLNLFDWVMFMSLDYNAALGRSLGSGWFRVLNGLFQSVSTRTAGFTTVSISDISPAVQVSYMLMMYVSVMPLAISIRRTNVYEEQSLGVYVGGRINTVNKDDPSGDLEKQNDEQLENSTRSFIGAHLRKQLSFDLWFLFLGLFIICICEGSRIQDVNRPYFTIWTVLFEVVSAYGNVGLSLGYPNTNTSFCAQFTSLSKLIIIFLLIRGKHRGLPYSLDRAIMLPSDRLQNIDNINYQMKEDAQRRNNNNNNNNNNGDENGDFDQYGQNDEFPNNNGGIGKRSHTYQFVPADDGSSSGGVNGPHGHKLARSHTVQGGGTTDFPGTTRLVRTATNDPLLAYWKKRTSQAKHKVQQTGNAIFHHFGNEPTTQKRQGNQNAFHRSSTFSTTTELKKSNEGNNVDDQDRNRNITKNKKIRGEGASKNNNRLQKYHTSGSLYFQPGNADNNDIANDNDNVVVDETTNNSNNQQQRSQSRSDSQNEIYDYYGQNNGNSDMQALIDDDDDYQNEAQYNSEHNPENEEAQELNVRGNQDAHSV